MGKIDKITRIRKALEEIEKEIKNIPTPEKINTTLFISRCYKKFPIYKRGKNYLPNSN